MSKQLPGGSGASWASALIPLLGADACCELGLDQHLPAQGGQFWTCLIKFEWFFFMQTRYLLDALKHDF